MTEPQKPPFTIVIVPVTPFQQNASIVICSATNKAAIVDPGGDLDQLQKVLAQRGAIAEKILLTHGHIDHAAGAAELAELLSVPIEGPHRGDEMLLKALPQQAKMFQMPGARAVTPDRWLEEGDEVQVGEVKFSVLHVPGHSPGSVVFVHRAAAFAITGDTLFEGSIGRTDFAYGDHDLLISGIKTKLLPLGDEVTILPGHGNPTTIGRERVSNPFIA